MVIDGLRFASQREGRRYQELCLLQKAGEITNLQCQVRFPLPVNGDLVCTYVADFTYRTKEGIDVVTDAKGVMTDVYKIKKKLMWSIYRIIIEEV